MNATAALAELESSVLVAVVRAECAQGLIPVLEALWAGGIRIAEVTFTIPDALEVLRAARAALPREMLLGAGTVLDVETGRAALLAGADFLVSPCLVPGLVPMAKRYSKLVMPGAFTPTEILSAWETGPDVVKVFPADVLGPSFFKAMRGPFPQIRLMPTGGVDLSTVGRFLQAGAFCLGVGSQLVDPKAIAPADLPALVTRARAFVAAVQAARSPS
jgi:2-dehydro-3-deoxyphosphogluconate aldolase/(4S)-4-hydroxy-2-oxoglutarate aldolase